MDFVAELKKDLEKELIQSPALFHGFLFLSADATRTPAYADPRYLPFYYYLSKYVQPQKLLEVGFTLGLHSGAFLRHNTSVEHFLGFQSPEEQPSRLGAKNIGLVYKKPFQVFVGRFFDAPLKEHAWDLVLWDKQWPYDVARSGLDRVWDSMALDGFLVYERLNGENRRAFDDFCKIHDRVPVVLQTRYGVGIVKR